MAGDYTRFTFRPEQDYAAVLMQQGKVQLDVDWNTLNELVDRRLRAETVDIMGRCAVPRETLDGFLITAAGGSYTIGIGRAYVNGLLAENRGEPPLTEFEPVWGERIGTQATPYGHQPYLSGAADPAGAGPHLFYLDVWNREVTAVEDDTLVDPAVGVDTTTRLQTVWQVKVLENVGAGVTCASNWSTAQKWVDLTTPSGARLTTADLGTPTSTDPCLVLPAGGYRGIDNRLYRIEIHDDGTEAGAPATLKWSRSNASVAARLTGPVGGSAAAPVFPVETIGRDAILRFHPGDWIELIDRDTELEGKPGLMVKIAANGVDAVRLELTLDPVSAALFTKLSGLGDEPRARRWDTRPGDASALIPFTSGTPIPLEDGIEVTVDVVAPGRVHTGDYWVFTARAATASVEVLNQAPPRGIRHHYCRLAVLNAGKLEDCRVLYPPEHEEHAGCDCDVCVSPQDLRENPRAIQDAIDQVIAKGGGKVCLLAGRYVLRDRLWIRGARSLTLAGKGHRTVLVQPRRRPGIVVERSVEVTIRDLAVATAKAGGGGAAARRPELAIVLLNSAGTTVERCFVFQAGVSVSPDARRRGGGAIGIGIAGFLAETVLRENVILADLGIASLTADRPIDESHGLTGEKVTAKGREKAEKEAAAITVTGVTRLPRYLLTHGLFIEDNLLACARAGIDLGRPGRTKLGSARTALIMHLGDTRIAGNSIYGCTELGVVAAGLVVGGAQVLRYAKLGAAEARRLATGSFAPLVPAVLRGGARLDVRSNYLAVLGHGLVIGCDDARVEANDVSALRGASSGRDGIRLVGGARGRLIDRCQVIANRVVAMRRHGISIGTGVGSALVKLNVIDSVGGTGIAMEGGGAAAVLAIENNQVLNAAFGLDDRAASAFGIVLQNADRLRVSANQVAGVGRDALTSPSRVGIFLIGCGEAVVAGNEVREVGPESEFTGVAIGIESLSPYERLEVVDNVVRVDDVGAGISRAHALSVGTVDKQRRLRGVRSIERLRAAFPMVTAADAEGVVLVETSDVVIRALPDTPVVSVHGNSLDTAGRSSAVEINGGGPCLFSDNRCQADGRLDDAVVSVATPQGSAIASANHITGAREASLSLITARNGANDPVATVLGNVTDGEIFLDGSPLQPPWDALNARI